MTARSRPLLVAGDHILALVLRPLGPGLLASLLHYRGLRRTPASATTIVERTFPLAAPTVDHLAFGATISTTQLLGRLTLAADR